MDVNLELAGETVSLLPERAAYWPRRKTLLVADLHWGKSEVLQRAGIPLPSAALGADLVRLTHAIDRTGAERVLALGDLVHAASGLTPAVADEVAAWRGRHSELSFELIRGNHDRRLALPPTWRLCERMEESADEAPFRFRHEPQADTPAGFVSWAGHIHPAVVLRAGRDRLRLPCFVVGSRSVLLPAFGSMTGGFDVKARAGERIFAVAQEDVVLV